MTDTGFFFVLFCDVDLFFERMAGFDFPSTARHFVFIHVEYRRYCEGQVYVWRDPKFKMKANTPNIPNNPDKHTRTR
jgi:hypothetical protein